MPTAVALLTLSLSYWGAVFLLPTATVSAVAWTSLFSVCAASCFLLFRRQALGWPPVAWLYLAACCLLLAALFYGANVGLDTLHGASRPKADVAASLSGLELWFVLAPGLASLCLGCSVGCSVSRHSNKGASSACRHTTRP